MSQHLPGFGIDSMLQSYTALPPLVYPGAKYLFLVTMPSYDSELTGEYFGDPSNHFWKVMHAIFQMPIDTYEEKKELCEKNGIALWSVVKSCRRHLSEQDTMQDIVLNDMQGFLNEHPTIQTIICVSRDAERLLKESNWEGGQTLAYAPSPSGADLYYEHLDELVPRYEAAMGLLAD